MVPSSSSVYDQTRTKRGLNSAITSFPLSVAVRLLREHKPLRFRVTKVIQRRESSRPRLVRFFLLEWKRHVCTSFSLRSKHTSSCEHSVFSSNFLPLFQSSTVNDCHDAPIITKHGDGDIMIGEVVWKAKWMISVFM